MGAGCVNEFARIFLFVFNFCLWICGIVLIGGGSYVVANYNDYVDLFSDDTILAVSWFAIGIGIFIFIVGFSGCWGAINKQVCLLRMYFTFVLLIVLAEITLGILAFVYSDDIEESMLEGMQKTISETYGDKSGATEAVDDVQEDFECCGANNYTDYAYSEHLQVGLAVPESCCWKNRTHVANCTAGAKGQPIYPELVWEEGCVKAAEETIEDHYALIGGVAFGLLIFEILTMVFACCVISGVGKEYETV